MPWRRLAASPQVWLLCVQYFCLSYAWYFYITWLPTYLKEARGLDLGKSARLGILPLFMGGAGSRWVDCGGAAHARYRKPDPRAAHAGIRRVRERRNPAGGLHAHPTSATRDDRHGRSQLRQRPSDAGLGACMDIGGKYAGTVSGAMNMMGNVGGAISPRWSATCFAGQTTIGTWHSIFPQDSMRSPWCFGDSSIR